MSPFSHLSCGCGFKDLNSSRVTTCAQTRIQGHNIHLIFSDRLIPANLASFVHGFKSVEIQQFGRSNQSLIIDNKFAANLTAESIIAQLCSHAVAPGLVTIRMFLPVTAIGLESVYAQFSRITVFIFGLVGTFPDVGKLILVGVGS